MHVHQFLDQPVNYSAAEDYITSHYDKLTELTISDTLIKSLYQMKVVTLDEKKAIKKLDDDERMEYLLDYVITPSLKLHQSHHYINFIHTLNNSDDGSMKDAGSELMSFLCNS